MYRWIDSHAHLTSASCVNEADALIEAASEAGVKAIVNICTDGPSLDSGLELKKRHANIYNVGATTPHDVDKEGEEMFSIFEKHARAGDFVAIGETGLDYYYEHSPRSIQQQFFRRYLRLAIETNLPVVIHCRDAFQDFFSILDQEYRPHGVHLPGVLHCFTGTIDEAKAVIDRGWYLSLSGIVTYKKSEDLRAVAAIVPLNRLLLETDTPYLAPQAKRGQKNQPAYLVETASVVASVKGVDLKTLAENTTSNACELFGIEL